MELDPSFLFGCLVATCVFIAYDLMKKYIRGKSHPPVIGYLGLVKKIRKEDFWPSRLEKEEDPGEEFEEVSSSEISEGLEDLEDLEDFEEPASQLVQKVRQTKEESSVPSKSSPAQAFQEWSEKCGEWTEMFQDSLGQFLDMFSPQMEGEGQKQEMKNLLLDLSQGLKGDRPLTEAQTKKMEERLGKVLSFWQNTFNFPVSSEPASDPKDSQIVLERLQAISQEIQEDKKE